MDCPFCVALQRADKNSPELHCSACNEFFCAFCFGQVHPQCARYTPSVPTGGHACLLVHHWVQAIGDAPVVPVAWMVCNAGQGLGAPPSS